MLRLLIMLMMLCAPIRLGAQLPKGPTIDDFELKGLVKTCIEQSAYGKEVFEFDREGRLIFLKSTFEPNQYQDVRFTYKKDTLTQKSIRVYRNDKLVKDESFLFQYDYLQGSYSELILRLDEGSVNFSKHYIDPEGRLLYSEIQEDKNIDRIDYLYVSSPDSIQITMFKNDLLTSKETKYFSQTGNLLKSVTLQFSGENPVQKIQSLYNTRKKITEQIQWQYSDSLNTSFSSAIRHINTYDEEGNLENKRVELSNSAKRIEYLYQYDQHSPKNWVKRIEKPSNHYMNRTLTYFEN